MSEAENPMQARISLAGKIMREALEEIHKLGVTPRIRDGAYEPDGSPIEIDNIDFDVSL